MAPSIQPGQGDLPPLHAGSPMEYKDGQIHFTKSSQSAYVEVNVKVDDHTTKTLKVTVHGVATEDDAIKKVNETLVKSVAIAMMHFDTGVKKVTIDNEKTIKHTETESKSKVIKSAVNLTSDLKTDFAARKEKIEKKEAGTLGRKWEGAELKEKKSNLETAIKIANLGSRTLTPGPTSAELEAATLGPPVPPRDEPPPPPLPLRDRDSTDDNEVGAFVGQKRDDNYDRVMEELKGKLQDNPNLKPSDIKRRSENQQPFVQPEVVRPEAAAGEITDHSSTQLHSMLKAAQGFADATGGLVNNLRESQSAEATNTTQAPAKKPSALEAFNKAASPPTSKRPNEGRPLPPIPGPPVPPRDDLLGTPPPLPPRPSEPVEVKKPRPPAPLPNDVQEAEVPEQELRTVGVRDSDKPTVGESKVQTDSQQADIADAFKKGAARMREVVAPDDGDENTQNQATDNVTHPRAATEKPSVMTEAAKASPPAPPKPIVAKQQSGEIRETLQDQIKKGVKLKKTPPSAPKPVEPPPILVNENMLNKAKNKKPDDGNGDSDGSGWDDN